MCSVLMALAESAEVCATAMGKFTGKIEKII